MGKVVKLDDYRASKHDRAVKKQKRDRLMERFNDFLKRTEIFFDKAHSERGKKMLKDLERGD